MKIINTFYCQPTSPFTLHNDIEKSVELVNRENIKDLISGYKLDQTHPDIRFFSNNGKIQW